MTCLSLCEAIDWGKPWLAPYRDAGWPVARRIAQGASVAEALNAQAQRPHLARGQLSFVPSVPRSEAYEAFIARTAQVPTRNNLHDLFNGLVWLVYPQLKRHLNGLQAREIDRDGVGAVRGPVRDALTVFDENAALLRAPQELHVALTQRDWTGLFVTQRAQWQNAELIVFGHALLEKLVQPRKAMTAHVWPWQTQADLLSPTAWLSADRLALKCHRPLPVLGVPGWWPANEEPDFYQDASVFRPGRG